MGATVSNAAASAYSADYASPGGLVARDSKGISAVRRTAVRCPLDAGIRSRSPGWLCSLPGPYFAKTESAYAKYGRGCWKAVGRFYSSAFKHRRRGHWAIGYSSSSACTRAATTTAGYKLALNLLPPLATTGHPGRL